MLKVVEGYCPYIPLIHFDRPPAPGFILLIENVTVIPMTMDIGLADNFPILFWPHV